MVVGPDPGLTAPLPHYRRPSVPGWRSGPAGSGQVPRRDLEVPFHAAGHGGMGHVGRTDIGGGKPGFLPEMPGLGMEPGAMHWNRAGARRA